MELLIYILLYAFSAYSLMIIAKKANTANDWMAWIPIANLYLMIKIAKKPGWWIILFIIPLVNLVFWIIVWMEIAKIRNKPSWLGILTIFPLVNLAIFGILAFTD